MSLVLDLDHTLIHATTEHIIQNIPSIQETKNLIEFTLPPNPTKYFVKLRPGLEQFLEGLQLLFEMHIYTMGTKQYATKIAEIIDKENIFFREHRIISRDDCPDFNFKNLQRLFPCDDSMVVIVDDRDDVWLNNQHQVPPNLIKIKPYHFFETFEEINQLPHDKLIKKNITPIENPQRVLDTKLDNNDTQLSTIYEILKKVHTFYYEQKLCDVKKILDNLRKKVLIGCEIVFSGLIPLNSAPENSEIWRLAEYYGAKCYKDFVPTITHLIAAKAGTGKVNKAIFKSGIMLVNPGWLYDSIQSWTKVDEHLYSVDGLPITNNTNEANYSHQSKKQKIEVFDSDHNEDSDETEMVFLIEQELEKSD